MAARPRLNFLPLQCPPSAVERSVYTSDPACYAHFPVEHLALMLMNLKLTLRMKIDDPASGKTRRFTKVVEGQAPHVPRVGEAVLIPGATARETLHARRVEEVIYPLDGTVILEFSLDGLFNSVTDQVKVLLEAGFREV